MFTSKISNYLFFFARSMVILMFLCYWSTTIIYCSPNNFIRIELIRYEDFFNSFFYQRWTFFTPPPKANERVYFLFIPNKSHEKIVSCEIFNTVRSKKRENPILNTDSEALDGILTSSTYALHKNIAEKLAHLKRDYPDSSKVYLNKKLNEIFINPNLQSTNFKTLKNYAVVVAKNYRINLSDCKLKIQMITIDIPPFKDRFNKKYQPSKRLIFETPPVSI